MTPNNQVIAKTRLNGKKPGYMKAKVKIMTAKKRVFERDTPSGAEGAKQFLLTIAGGEKRGVSDPVGAVVVLAAPRSFAKACRAGSAVGTFGLLLACWLVASPPAKAADIYGAISYRGTPPPETPITPLKNDPNCGPLHTEMPTTHFYEVGTHGELGDVVVSLAGIPSQSTGPAAEPLLIDQKGCEYTPYVSACQTGQKITVKNSDPVMHNVHATPRKRGNEEQNRVQPPKSPDLTFVFNTPESFIRFKCDVHPCMFAYVSVVDHPYYSVSGEDGTYRIHNVPPGQYTVVAAHRKAGTLRKKVVVKDQSVQLDFVFRR